MKRPAPWQARRIATQKALRELPKCETDDCGGRAFGVIRDPDSKLWRSVCPRCAADVQLRDAQRAQREKQT